MLAELNYINGNSKFIAEEEEEEVEEEVNKVMLFLDCLFSRKKRSKSKTSICKKKTHIGKYSNFYLNQPLPIKLSPVKALIKRANYKILKILNIIEN